MSYIFFYLISLILFTYGLLLLFVPFYTIFCQLNGYYLVQVDFFLLSFLLEFINFYLNFLSFFLDFKTLDIFFLKEVQVYFLSENFNFNFIYFSPVINNIWLKIGYPVLAFYELCNDSPINSFHIFSIYNISPSRAGLYFNKIECFCFEEQIINPLSCYFLPIFFYIDPSISFDFNMGIMDIITVTYILI